MYSKLAEVHMDALRVGTVDAPDVNDMAAILASASIFALHYFWRSQNLVIKSLCVIGGAQSLTHWC